MAISLRKLWKSKITRRPVAGPATTDETMGLWSHRNRNHAAQFFGDLAARVGDQWAELQDALIG